MHSAVAKIGFVDGAAEDSGLARKLRSRHHFSPSVPVPAGLVEGLWRRYNAIHPPL